MNSISRLALVGGLLAALLPLGGGAAKNSVTYLAVTQSPVQPVEFKQVGPGHVFVDFGRAAFAGLQLHFPQAEDGRKVVVHLGEKLSAPGVVDRKPGGSVRYFSAELTLKAGQEKYLVPLKKADARLMMPEIGPVMPFRYVEIENAPASLAAAHVVQLVAHYPFDDAAGQFRCSDEKINAIWELCKYSMKATSFGGVFVDGDRERKPYEADAYINQLGWYYTTGELGLPRYSHEYLITHPTWPTEWILFSVLMAWEDYLFSGDAASMQKFYPDLQAKTLLALARADGLISIPKGPLPAAVGNAIHIKTIRDIVDWPLGERDGYDLRPVNTVVNAFHARALDRMALIAAALGKTDDAARYRAAAARVTQTLNEKMFDKATGLYLDGEGSTHSSLHANMFPLAFGLVPPERRARVTAFVRGRGMACSVYAAQFLMDALFDAGEAQHALALMTAPGDRSWTHMIERVGTTISLEAWDTKYKPNQDWNHAWGAAPASVLPRKLMGIEPVEPGWKKFQIRPQLGNLQWAEARTPTPCGSIFVRAEAGPAFKLIVEIPAGTTAQVSLPARDAAAVTESGKPISRVQGVTLLRASAGRAELSIAPGRYRFESPAP